MLEAAAEQLPLLNAELERVMPEWQNFLDKN